MGLFGKKHSIGKTITELRKKNGWTQIELAEKLQVSDKAISKWEKDSGAPSIEFFPLLAELFDVSIDYLMTGKKAEKEILTISKAELCAKKDDITLLNGIDAGHKDENGKTLIDYIIKYESYKVFIAFCNADKRNVSKFDILTALKYCIILNRLDLLKGASFSFERRATFTFEDEYEILSLLVKEDEKNFTNDYNAKTCCVLTNDILKVIVCDNRINDETYSILFGNQRKRQCVWYHVFPFLIHQAYINNKIDMLERLLKLSIESNERGFSKYVKTNNASFQGRYYYIRREYDNVGHGFVRVLEETIKEALGKGDFAYIEKFNQLNSTLNSHYNHKSYVANADELRVAKLSHDKSVSKDELAVQSSIHDGIIHIEELLAIKNVKVIKKALNDYPIHLVEKLFALYDKKQWKELFQWAVDVNNHEIYNAIIKENFEKIDEEICKYSKIETADFKANRKYLNIIERKETISRGVINRTIRLDSKTKKEDLLGFFKTCKIQILENITLSIDKEETIAELSKEFFEKELTKGNTEMVIIKLCVRLESVLKCNYHYEGDFADMITQYCNEKLNWQEDDGWGYTVDQRDDKKIKILHKLRKQRNSIVHSEKNNEPMTIAEIKECIDLVCAIK